MAALLAVVIPFVAQLLSPLATLVRQSLSLIFHRRALTMLGVGSTGAIATWLATQIIMAGFASLLASAGLGAWGETVDHLFVHGVPRSIRSAVSLLATVPGFIALLGGAAGAKIGLRV